MEMVLFPVVFCFQDNVYLICTSNSNRDSAAFMPHFSVFKKKIQIRRLVFVNETHLEQILLSQVYWCVSGNDYFGKRGWWVVHSGRLKKIGTAVD